MRFYCTIFDKNYLLQGVTLFNSLKLSSRKFRFYALCMDSEAYELLIKMNLEDFIPVKLDDVLTQELTEVQSHTTKGQFCWVLQPVFCQFILENFEADMVIYLEADSLFFSDPEAILEELGDGSVSIVPHNFSSDYDNSEAAGKFCVQFNAFKNDDNAKAVLKYWKSECFKYSKDNLLSYPGQTCLDEWPGFKGVKIIENIGAGVAPWNMRKFNFSFRGPVLEVDNTPIIFFHYHAFGFYPDGDIELGLYPVPKPIVNSAYNIYVKKLNEAEKLILACDNQFLYRRVYASKKELKALFSSDWRSVVHQYYKHAKRVIKGIYNIYSQDYFKNLRNGILEKH
jgi:hypothetical protein